MKIIEVWNDIESGKLPILFDSENRFQSGISPVSKYSNYQSDENGDYDLTIMGVASDFFEEMEAAIKQGKYKKYDVADDDMSACTVKAWSRVWSDQKDGLIHRLYTADYESTVPSQYTKDGKVHCYLYIAIK